MFNLPVESPRIAIILPAYNECLTIEGTIRAFHRQAPDAEIWVIDNNSSDDTGAIASTVMTELAANGGVLLERRQGKGNAVRRAFHDVEADIYVLADADMTYPADQLADLIAPVAEGRADMVVGDRHTGGHYSKENKRPLHGLGNDFVRWLVNRLFKAKLADIMSGYRAMSRLFVKNYPILVDGFEIETDMTLHALDKRLRIVEIPVEYRDRPVGSFSKLNTLVDGLRVVNTIGRILRYYRPLVFFGNAGLLVAAMGLMASVPVMQDWIQTHYIYHVPLAILATGLEIVAVVLIAIGLILDCISYHDKLNYERELLNFSRR
jgi:glycosyltransferase involved in cell wall biosynthesis